MRVAFVGKTAHDNLGLEFVKDLHKNQVEALLPCLGNDTPSSASMIYITEDGDRTMATYLGISHEMRAQDIPMEQLLDTHFIVVESYLLDIPSCKSMLASIFAQAEKESIKVVFTITDTACAERHADFIKSIIASAAIVFGTKEVFQILYGEDEQAAIEERTHHTDQLIIMTGKTGTWLVGDKRKQRNLDEPQGVIDRTAADDIFIAGFLTAYKENKNTALCMEFARKVSHDAMKVFGGRLQTL